MMASLASTNGRSNTREPRRALTLPSVWAHRFPARARLSAPASISVTTPPRASCHCRENRSCFPKLPLRLLVPTIPWSCPAAEKSWITKSSWRRLWEKRRAMSRLKTLQSTLQARLCSTTIPNGAFSSNVVFNGSGQGRRHFCPPSLHSSLRPTKFPIPAICTCG
jgi:hypothetical protein